MNALTNEQIEKLAQSIIHHCLSDRGFLYHVSRTYASNFNLEAYQQWFDRPNGVDQSTKEAKT